MSAVMDYLFQELLNLCKLFLLHIKACKVGYQSRNITAFKNGSQMYSIKHPQFVVKELKHSQPLVQPLNRN